MNDGRGRYYDALANKSTQDLEEWIAYVAVHPVRVHGFAACAICQKETHYDKITTFDYTRSPPIGIVCDDCRNDIRRGDPQ